MVAKEVGVLSNAELAKIAKDEVNEEPERLAEDLQAVKDWLEKQPHLQNVRKGKLFNLVTRLVKKRRKRLLPNAFLKVLCFLDYPACHASQCSLYVTKPFFMI